MKKNGKRSKKEIAPINMLRQKEKKEHSLFLFLKYILWNTNEELFYIPCNF